MPIEPLTISELAERCLASACPPFATDTLIWAYRRQCASGKEPDDATEFANDLIVAMIDTFRATAARFGYPDPTRRETQGGCYGPCRLPQQGCYGPTFGGGSARVEHTEDGWKLPNGETFITRYDAELGLRRALAVAEFETWLRMQNGNLEVRV